MQQVDDDTMALAREMHRLRTLGAATKWTDLDRLLEALCGPMERKKRCRECDGRGQACYAYWKGIEPCRTCNGHGYVILGTERKMDCPACGDQPNAP